MVKEIKDRFESLLKPLKDARALRDELAEQAPHSTFSASCHPATLANTNSKVRNLKKIAGCPIRKYDL